MLANSLKKSSNVVADANTNDSDEVPPRSSSAHEMIEQHLSSIRRGQLNPPPINRSCAINQQAIPHYSHEFRRAHSSNRQFYTDSNFGQRPSNSSDMPNAHRIAVPYSRTNIINAQSEVVNSGEIFSNLKTDDLPMQGIGIVASALRQRATTIENGIPNGFLPRDEVPLMLDLRSTGLDSGSGEYHGNTPAKRLRAANSNYSDFQVERDEHRIRNSGLSQNINLDEDANENRTGLLSKWLQETTFMRTKTVKPEKELIDDVNRRNRTGLLSKWLNDEERNERRKTADANDPNHARVQKGLADMKFVSISSDGMDNPEGNSDAINKPEGIFGKMLRGEELNSDSKAVIGQWFKGSVGDNDNDNDLNQHAESEGPDNAGGMLGKWLRKSTTEGNLQSTTDVQFKKDDEDKSKGILKKWLKGAEAVSGTQVGIRRLFKKSSEGDQSETNSVSAIDVYDPDLENKSLAGVRRQSTTQISSRLNTPSVPSVMKSMMDLAYRSIVDMKQIHNSEESSQNIDEIGAKQSSQHSDEARAKQFQDLPNEFSDNDDNDIVVTSLPKVFDSFHILID